MAQPPPSRLSPRGLLSLPYRLCNPPPAVGKVRSCGVTPVVDVRLDDVLARRHLPPIGLKDFEEYLLYVEHAPENLYFTLWLKDYTARYHAWAQREKSTRMSKKEKLAPRLQRATCSLPPTPDPALAMFYLRAKQTFFTPKGEYELNIPSDVLAPFHCSPYTHPVRAQDHNRSLLWHSQSVHPDPAVFSEVAIEARNMLNESLKRFIRAAYTNVGSQRAACGIIAGCLFTLVAGVLPLILTTGRWNIGPHGRLIRLTALPGLWFGLTVLIASLQGICIMIYVFGDLRQLRKFELTRPTISKPIPMPISSPMPSRSAYIPSRPVPLPLTEKTTVGGPISPTLAGLDSPTTLVGPARPYARSSSRTSVGRTSYDSGSCDSDVCSSAGCNVIVSPAYFDDVPAPEGPATASCLHRPEYLLPPSSSITYVEPAHVRPDRHPFMAVEANQSTRGLHLYAGERSEYGPTAGFIPHEYGNASMTSLGETIRSLRSQRSRRYFDFDLLPSASAPAPGKGRRRDVEDGIGIGEPPPVQLQSSWSSSVVAVDSTSVPMAAAIGRAQYKCNQPHQQALPDPARPSVRRFPLTVLIPSFTAGVPAFAAPMTQIQSPVVKRAQWEIVVRAAAVSAVIAGTVTGIVVGVVP